jgi:hypothetical protein
MYVIVGLLQLILAPASVAHAQLQDHCVPQPHQCTLYMAPSTIPNGGLGIFAGVAMGKGDFLPTEDIAIPLVDLHKHNQVPRGQRLDSILSNYVWNLDAMGMDREAPHGSAIVPGVHAAANSLPAMINVEAELPMHSPNRGNNRSRHPTAGAMTHFAGIRTFATRDIPQGGELFVHYGDSWFTSRNMTNVPLQTDLKTVRQLMIDFGNVTEAHTAGLQRDLWALIISMPFSSVITSVFPDDVGRVSSIIENGDLGLLFQANARASIEYLEQNGICLDTIQPQQSTIPGAGFGAFATRSFAQGGIIISSPVLHIRNFSSLQMYEKTWSESGKWKPSNVVESHQLLVNYCFGHVNTTMMLCPYASGVNYLNHNRSKANVRVQWSTDGRLSHNQTIVTLSPNDIPVDKVGLALDYIALRDITAGEELFLDAGTAWEEAWQIHVELWDADDDTHDEELASTLLNERQDPLRTRDEQRINPYPHHELHCHESLLVDYFNWRSIVIREDLWAAGGRDGIRCNILRRYANQEGELVYDVNFFEDENDMEVQNRNVPRNAFYFVERYYSSDMHSTRAFRYPYQIPDDMMPLAWMKESTEIFE